MSTDKTLTYHVYNETEPSQATVHLDINLSKDEAVNIIEILTHQLAYDRKLWFTLMGELTQPTGTEEIPF